MELNRRYGIATTVYFPLIDAGATDFEATPVTFAAADTQVSIDGGAFANTGSTPAHEGNGVYSLALTAAEMQGQYIVITCIDAATKEWEDQAVLISTDMGGQIEANQGIIIGEINDVAVTPSSTAFEADRLAPNITEEATADHYNNRNILFTSGALLGVMTDITDYALQNAREYFTVTAMIGAPADGDRFVVL